MEQEPAKIITQEQARVRWLKSLEQRDGKKYFSSGFKSHDQVAGRLLRGSQYIVAARPGVGKTAFLVSLAFNLSRAGIEVVYASLEIPVPRLWNRLACLRDKSLTLRQLNEPDENLTIDRAEYFEKLSREIVKFSPMFFENYDFKLFLDTMIETVKPGSDSCVMVDYAGLFTLKGLGPSERYWLMSEVAKQLSILARTLDVPVVTAVQFNRAIENRKEKFPLLSDLRDTGEWENHARGVFMLMREDAGALDVYVRKNTEGPNDVYYSLAFDGPRAAVEEMG
jgi:replicative DNA helicase